MAYAVYLAALSGQNSPYLLFSRAFSKALPVENSPLDDICEFNLQGIDTVEEDRDKEQQLLRAYEGNDFLEFMLIECKSDFTSASAQSGTKLSRKDFVSGSFRLFSLPLLVHWMSTSRGTALLMVTPADLSASVIRTNLRMIMTSLNGRIRLDQPREVLIKPHIIALTLKYFMPNGQLLVHPAGIQKDIDEAIGKLLK